MTVGIAAIARSGHAIVAMADRRLTYGDNEFVVEMAATKLLRTGGGFWTLFSGDPTMAQVVVGGVPDDSRLVPKDLREMYVKIRQESMVRSILEPRLLTRDLYIARSTTLHPFDERYRSEIDKEIKDFDLGCELLTMGFMHVEETPGQLATLGTLITIEDPGDRFEQAYEGYACIGSGAKAALSALIFNEIDPNDDIDIQLYQLLYAKAHSEMTPFVGFEGDAWILLPGHDRPITVEPWVMKMLNDALDAHTRLPFKHRQEWEHRPGWEKPKGKPPRWQERLKKWVDDNCGKVRD